MADNLIHHEQILGHEQPPLVSSYPTSSSTSGGNSRGDWQHLDSRQTVPPQLHALQMPVHSFQHYHQQAHVISAAASGGDPSPSVFSSPTDSSPSGSPYHPDHLHYQHHHHNPHHYQQHPHLHQHQYDQRRRNSTFPLFLAQHTPVTPISIDPMDQHASGMSSTSYNPYLSPPSTTTLVGPTDRPHMALPYLQSPTASYNYCPPMHEYGHGSFGGAGVGIHHRRRLSMLTPGSTSSPSSSYPYQHPQYTHAHEAPDGSYAVLMGSYPPMEEPMKMGQYTPESPEAVWHQKDHYAHYGQQASYQPPPGQPQLLLANAMPTNAPIVIDDPSLSTPRGSIIRHEQHGYEYPSHATRQSPSGYGPGSSTSQGGYVSNVAISTPAMHTATAELTHVYPSSNNNGINGQEGGGPPPTSTVVGGGYNSNGTDMGIYANQTTASIVANGGSFTGQQPIGDGGPLPPILRGTAVTTQPSPAGSTDLPSIARLSPHSQDQGSSFNSSTSTSSSSTSNSVRAIVADENSRASEKAAHEQRQYVPKEENVRKEDQPRSHLSHNVSDVSENAFTGEKNGDAIHHAESGKAACDTQQQQQPELSTTRSGAATTTSPRTPVDQSIQAEKKQQNRHADDDQPSDASTAGSEGRLNSTTVKSQIKDVAVVASLPQSTAPGQMEYGRYENTTVDPSKSRRVNCTGPGDLPNSLVGEVNTTGSTIKTPEPNETKPLPLTYLAPTSDQGATNIPDAASAPATTTTPTSDSVHSPNIDRSYPHPHPSSDEMQAISTQSYPHGSDAHHFSFSSSYTFPARPATYSSGSYNNGNNTHHHLPAVPSLLRPEWHRSSHSDYSVTHPHHHEQDIVSNFPRQSSISTEDGSNGRSLSPTPTPTTTGIPHRNSLPNVQFKSEPASIVGLSSPHTSPPQATGYHTPSGGNAGGRLVPAAFGNGTPGSASSASSTPPTALLDASSAPVSLYRYEGAAASSQPPLGGAGQAVAYGSPPDQKGHFDSSSSSTYSGFQAAPYSQSRGHESPYYQPPPPPPSSYPHHHDYAYNGHGANYPRPFDSSRTRGSSSPAPPMIAGAKRGREDEWFTDGDDEAREARRRRSSYAQSQAMIAGMHHYSNHSVAVSPSIPPAEMGVIRVSNYTPTLKDMGIGSVDTFSPLQDRMGNGRRAGDGAIRSGSDTSYSFISLPGNTVRKRPRRKFEEITRNYVCNWPGCTKAYGTLNHLNAHVTMQKHGVKRLPAEFKELRKLWRKQKREQAQRQAMRQDSGQMFLDDDGDDFDDDEQEQDQKSVYNGVVEIMH